MARTLFLDANAVINLLQAGAPIGAGMGNLNKITGRYDTYNLTIADYHTTVAAGRDDEGGCYAKAA